MATFDQSIVSVSGRLTHEWDFTFYKNSGEIANRIRTELGSALKEIRIDKDGDIDIDSIEEGNFVVTWRGNYGRLVDKLERVVRATKNQKVCGHH